MISDLHNTPALKDQREAQVLRQERGAQTCAMQWVQGKAEQGNRQGPGKVAQPQPLCRHLALSKPHCQDSKVSQGNRASTRTLSVTVHSLLATHLRFKPSGLFCIALSLVIAFSVACLFHLSSAPTPGTSPVDTPFSFSPSHPPTGCQFLCSHLSPFPFAGDWQLPTI